MRRSQQRGAGSIRGERASIHFQHEDRVCNKSQGHRPGKIQQPRLTLSEDAQRYAREKRPRGNADHDFPKARRWHHSVRASAIVEPGKEENQFQSSRATRDYQCSHGAVHPPARRRSFRCCRGQRSPAHPQQRTGQKKKHDRDDEHGMRTSYRRRSIRCRPISEIFATE